MNPNSQVAAPNPAPQDSKLIYIGTLLVPFLLGSYLVLTSTVYLLNGLAILDAKRLLELALILVIILVALLSSVIRAEVSGQLQRVSPIIRIGLCLFFFLGIVSAVFNSRSALNLSYSLAEVALLALITVVIVIVAACRSIAGANFDRLAIGLISLLGLAVGVQELVGTWVTWSFGSQFSYEWSLAHFAHPRFYNQLQSWTVPAIAALPLLFPRSKLAIFICIASLGMHWYILLLTGARGGIVSLILALIAASFFSPAARKAILKWQTAGILLGFAIYFSMYLGPQSGWEPFASPTSASSPKASVKPDGQSSLSGKRDDAARSKPPNPLFEQSLGRPLMHTTGRTRLWKIALNYTLDNPALGIGPMNYACQGTLAREGHPHSFYMQIVSEWGVPAAAILLAVLTLIFMQLRRGLQKSTWEITTPEALPALLACSVLAALILAAVDGVFVLPASQIAACMMAGWLLGIFSNTKVTNAEALTKLKFIAPVILLAAITVSSTLFIFSIKESLRISDYEQRQPAISYFSPRYWQAGKACGH